MNYEAYLLSPEWAVVRRLALEQADNACRLCGSTAELEVHHRTYERLGRERLADVIVLCDPCHARHHGDRQAPLSLVRESDVWTLEPWARKILSGVSLADSELAAALAIGTPSRIEDGGLVIVFPADRGRECETVSTSRALGILGRAVGAVLGHGLPVEVAQAAKEREAA